MSAEHRPDPAPEPRDGAADPASTPAPEARRRRVWRLGTPLVVVVCGALFVVSASSSDGTDLRPGRYTDLASLVQNESDDYALLQQQAADLKTEVDALSASVVDKTVRRIRREADDLRRPAGLTAARGPGIRVVLSDASVDKLEAALNDPDLEIDRFVVHQQDIQAVVNALWAGGAEAMTIQGQRVVSTTGIKCTGSAVTLQGVPYPQPYVIEAIGDPLQLASALDADTDVGYFRVDASLPEIGLGYEMELEEEVEAPAFDGLLDIGYAVPLTQGAAG
ncbi:MAG: hypothetical protein CMH83_15625 [Nocardioides sp.]|nr:hypothetical protein [Nocardioides sp.]